MASRIVSLSLIAFCGALLGTTAARAQEEVSNAPPRPVPSLSERLQQFRQDLLGGSQDSDQAVAPEDLEPVAPTKPVGAQYTSSVPSAARKSGMARSAPYRSRLPAPSQQMSANPPAQTSVARLPNPPQSAPRAGTQAAPVAPRATGRLEQQSARKARPTQAPTPAEPTPASIEPQTVADDAFGPPVEEPLAEEIPTLAQPSVETSDPNRTLNEPRVARAVPRAEFAPAVQEPSAAETPAVEDQDTVMMLNSPVLSVEAAGPRTVRVGQEAEFIVKIHNAGTAADNVVVTVDVPEHAEVAAAHASSGAVPVANTTGAHGPLEWQIPRLEGNRGETLNLTLVPRKSDPLGLAVRFSYTPEASQLSVEVQEAKLEMAVSGPNDVLYGETKIYRLTLSNPGNGDAENVVITLLPVGDGGATASHKLGTLRAGESRNVEVELTARQAGSITIKAQAFADHGLRSEAAEQVFVRRASLQVGVEAPRVTFAGTAGTYRVTVVNSGDASASDVNVAAMLPPDAKYLASSAGGQYDSQQGKVTWTVGNLAPGTERSFDLKCSLATPGDNRMQFVASAEGNLSSSAASTTQVEALADLKIELRDPQGPVAVGNEAVYELVIRNRGSAAAHNVDLVAFFSEGLEATTVDGGGHEIATGQVIFKPILTIGAGETITFKVHAQADREGHHVFRCELFCESLHTKLAAEEATFFYGSESLTPSASEQATHPEPTPDAPVALDTSDDAPPLPE
jgi:uncharacterized repeat protein (TIGR01451 family)